jgi:hypothetical protein
MGLSLSAKQGDTAIAKDKIVNCKLQIANREMNEVFMGCSQLSRSVDREFPIYENIA